MIRLAVRVLRDDAETALHELLAFSPAGVEELDVDEATVEYVLYGTLGALPSQATLRARIGDALLATDSREIADDWQERWRAFHQPVTVAQRFRVRAPWHASAPGELIDLVIEPGRAFGTGAHATTRLCIELLVTLERSGLARGSLLDLGCGSGVLAIAAAKLGFAPVAALDNDPLAIEATAANAAANGVTLELCEADLQADPLPAAETIVANLLFEPLLALARRPEQPRPRRLIASGLLADQADELVRELERRHQLRERARRSEGGWLALLLDRNDDPRVSS